MTRKLISLAAGAAMTSFAFAGAAYAGDLAYAPTELSSDAGVNDVYHRIQVAAARKCDDRLNHDSVVKYRAVRDRCVSDVVDELVHKVNDSRLDRIHAEHKNDI